MALINMNIYSQELECRTDVNVIIPTEGLRVQGNEKKVFYKGVQFPVLYLLHGAYGDYSDWVRFSNIERYADEHQLAVIMPSAENSYYQDMKYGQKYVTYLTEELPGIIETMFPISEKREDTFVAGLSMGGYGALHLAFRCPEKYSACASLSGAVDIVEVFKGIDQKEFYAPFHFERLFGNDFELEGSKSDLFALYKSQNTVMPKVFQSCGTEDFLYGINQLAYKKFTEIGVDITYEEHPGIHDWNYWDLHIQRAIKWFLQ